MAADIPKQRRPTRRFTTDCGGFERHGSCRPSLTTYPPTNAVRQHDQVCPYRGAVLSDATRTKEHVIGRKFIPRGKLNGRWNLILNVRSACDNNTKSGLEDDISAISRQPDAHGNCAVDDAALAADARRTAGNSAITMIVLFGQSKLCIYTV